MASTVSPREPQSRTFPVRRYRLEVTALFTLLVLFAVFAARYQWLQSIDNLYYDALLTVAPAPLDDRVVIVGIDEQSLTAVGRWPWSRAQQAELIERVIAQSPKAVLVDVVYSGETETAADSKLVAAFADGAVMALPVIFDALALNRPPIEVLPFPQLLSSVDVLGHVHIELDRDSISRGTYLYQGIGEPHWPHLALGLAEQLGWLPEPALRCEEPALAFSLANQRCRYVLVPFAGPPGTVPQLSALSLLEDAVPQGLLAGKVVVLGLTAAGVADWVTSPVSGDGRPISGAEYNANVFNALIQNRLVEPAPSWLTRLLCGMFAALAAVLLPRLSPKAMLGGALLLGLTPFVVSAVSLLALQRFLPLSAAVVAALLAYPYWSWRRHEIAWRYIDQEMSRIAAVRDSYAGAALVEPTDWSNRVERLAQLLGLTVATDPHPVLDRALEIDPDRRQLVVLLGEAGVRKLSPDESSADPGVAGFDEAERSLIEQTFAELNEAEQRTQTLPGESLAARIRILRNENRIVQLGRETSMQALEEMTSGVSVVSALGEILFANSEFTSMTDVHAGTALFADPDARFELSQRLPLPIGRNWLETWREVSRGHRVSGFESKLLDGRLVYVSCAPLDVDEAGTWVLTITDVTEITTAQNMREEALAFLSHDLRSPILSVLALVRQGVMTDRDRQIERYAQKSLTVSEQFLQLSRLESQTQVETYELDVLSVLHNALDQVYAQAQEAKILVDRSTLDALPEEDVFIMGNGELLERAFVNLLSNAIKYSNANDVVTVSGELSTHSVALCFEDQGVGIPAEDLPRLFEPYFRSSEPSLARRKGAGLGLRFTKTVVERHGGELRVDSEFGKGSRFTVLLPRTQTLKIPDAAEAG